MATCPEAVARRLDYERGLEIVRVQFNGEWIQGLNYVGEHRNEEGGQEEYRRYLAHYAGYPEEEWWRVRGIRVVPEANSRYPNERCIELEVEFANIGKCVESLLLQYDHMNVNRITDDGITSVIINFTDTTTGENDLRIYPSENLCATTPTSPT